MGLYILLNEVIAMLSNPTETFDIIVARSSAVIAHFCDSLNVVRHINGHMTWDPNRSEMSPGEAIKVLVINLLVKRDPLYRVEAFYEQMDIPNLFNIPWQVNDFNDDWFV